MLRTFAINSNQIVLSFGILIDFLSPKQSKIEESSLESMTKQMESSETWRTEALKSFAISKSGMQGGEAKRNLPWSILDNSHVIHFWSTSWSPIYACYMLFRSSGSQQSNASNGAWFGVKMKKLQSLETDHSKLKENFTRLRNQPWAAKMLSFCCENFAAILHSATEFLLKLPDICDRHFEIFRFRYLMSKSPNSHCNPSTIGFFSL